MPTTDHFKDRVVSLAIEVRDEVVDEWTPPDNDECEICGQQEFRKKKIPYDCGCEFYSVDCPECDGQVAFYRWYVRVGDEIPISREEFSDLRCYGECDAEYLAADLVDGAEPVESTTYKIPLKGILRTKIDEHHTSYIPEETMKLCSQCHMKIHHNDEFRPDLEPDMKRSDWEEIVNE